MTVAYGLSFAALIFSASLHTWLAYGIAATFITTAIGGSFVAARSSLPFAIAAPDGATAAITATLAATEAQRLTENGAARRPFGPGHDRGGPRDVADRHSAFLPRPRAGGRRDPLHPLPRLSADSPVAGLVGGYVSCISLSQTTLVYSAGGRGPICGLTVAAASVLMLTVDPSFIAYIPKFVLGGLLLYLGASLVYEWLVDAARRISLLEYASLLAIALLIVQFGFIAGVLIGVIIGCATFAVSASRVNAIKFRFDGSEYRSTLDRGPEELAILAAHGSEIQGMSLQSYLFFGSANRLYQQVKALFANQPDCRFLMFDFRLVTGIDSSAMHSFTQIKQVA